MLLSYITLRRPKQLTELPARKDKINDLTFTADEREHYDNFKGQTIHKIDLALDTSRANSSLNALQWITSLRLICNHGLDGHRPTSEKYTRKTRYRTKL